MNDPHSPKLKNFRFVASEQAAILDAMKDNEPWDWKPSPKHKQAFKSTKSKIVKFHMKRQRSLCCYCQSILHDGKIMIDREHILPKGKPHFKSFTFAIWNLSVACKRCNMNCKGGKEDFVINATGIANFKLSSNYRFIHPNFDRWKDHLSRFVIQIDDHFLVKYACTPGSAKGAYTYDYFRLKELEVISFDAAQGLDTEGFVGLLSQQARELATHYGQ